jgi:hypothetical protein
MAYHRIAGDRRVVIYRRMLLIVPVVPERLGDGND